MRPALFSTLAAALVLTPQLGFSQTPSEKPKPANDEFRTLLKEIEEAYKAPLEVDEDVLDELRKQYRNPTPERELKIFKEIRRLYDTTPELEEAILREIRAAYQQPTAEQEMRVFAAIRRAGQLPLGTVPASIQLERATKLFAKLDEDRDGVLTRDEMPETLRDQRVRWDANRDGTIDFQEYAPYFQAQLKWVSDGVASGEFPIRLPKSAAASAPAPMPAVVEKPKVAVAPPAAGLPDWFTQLDLDGDGQVGLYEWRQKGRAIKDFVALDLNSDGFLTAKEVSKPAGDSTSKQLGR
jgi:hypothetical protein